MNGLKPYQGSEPYIFISYAHADEQAVGDVLEKLEQRGVHFWFDDGIEVGSEWPEYIAERLASAAMMLAFISNAYARSGNCRKEMHYAVSKGIKTINVFLEDAHMTPGMTLQIGNIFALMKYRMEEHAFYERLYPALQLPAASESAGNSAEPAETAAGTKKTPQHRAAARKIPRAAIRSFLTGGFLFLPGSFAVSLAALSAAKSVSLSREEALAAAELCFQDLVGEESARSFYVDYITMKLRHDGSLFKGTYIYQVEYQNRDGAEYKIEVNAASGKTVIRDID